MDNPSFFSSTAKGMAWSVVVSLAIIQLTDIIQTAVVAVVATTVSFVVTHILKMLFGKRKK